MARKLLSHHFFYLRLFMLATRVGLIASAVNPLSGQHLRVLAGEVLHLCVCMCMCVSRPLSFI